MTWDGVPWMVDGGVHNAEVGRLLAYSATGGNEGVVGVGDCKVVASNIPDGNVHINSGGVVALNRFPGGGQQSYILRNEGDAVIALDPQGSSGVRYDLVAVIVEDPQYVGQPEPADEASGPYVRTAVYKNVGPTASTLAEVDPDQTGLVLARVKFDASDGTVTNADITDLRALATPKSLRNIITVAAPPNEALTSGALTIWPPVTPIVDIPAWATDMTVIAHLSSIVCFGPDVNGTLRLRLGGVLYAPEFSYYDLDIAAGVASRVTFAIGGTFEIPEELRGTSQGLEMMGLRNVGAGYLTTWEGPIMFFDVSFNEKP